MKVGVEDYGTSISLLDCAATGLVAQQVDALVSLRTVISTLTIDVSSRFREGGTSY